jgi:hypothetical protein
MIATHEDLRQLRVSSRLVLIIRKVVSGGVWLLLEYGPTTREFQHIYNMESPLDLA